MDRRFAATIRSAGPPPLIITEKVDSERLKRLCQKNFA